MSYIVTNLEKELIYLLIDCKVEEMPTLQIMAVLKTEKQQNLMKDWILKQKTLPTQEKIIAKTEKIIAKSQSSQFKATSMSSTHI